ncbi:AIPR family protein [Sanguibacter sp. 25GB23B1]|uniref:AIPR family protein n=1 Tax=unclassified Sanguibacter TaxID=2645534 RepID=UPI0032AEFEEC
MTANDVILLADMIEKARGETEEVLSDTDHETYFTARNYLRAFQPSTDDLLSGIVDGTLDGGIDGLYVFVNGFCVRDDTGLSGLGRHAEIDLVVLQVKNTKGFGEAAIDKLVVNLPRLLDFSRDDSTLSRAFNPRVLEVSRRFLDTYRGLDMPALRIFVCFASLRADDTHPNTVAKGDLIVDTLKRSFAYAQTEVAFLDAATLADQARERPPITKKLALAEIPISTETAGGYIGVVKLDEYDKFITDETGKLNTSLFEANVRDYEGDTSVNRSIGETLEREDTDIDFWWLNNGVTIVANRVQPAGKMLELDSPQIVNGLQTSHEIYKRGRVKTTSTDSRSVLVKVVQARDDSTRDRIIRATNSQTSLASSALRATDKVQRQIEEHLQKYDLYYERRRNLYQNRGIPIHKLVSIEQMGQAILSTMVQAPHVARGNLTRVFEPEIYDKLFASTHEIGMFSSAISIQRDCEAHLRESPALIGQVEDYLFHLTTLATMVLTRKQRPNAADIARMPPTIAKSVLEDLYRIIRDEFLKAIEKSNEALVEKAAKSLAVTNKIVARGRTYLSSSPRNSVRT